MIKKFWALIVAFFAGIAAVFAYKSRTNHREDTSPYDDSIDSVREDLEELREKENKLKEDGVEDKTAEEELDYWKNN